MRRNQPKYQRIYEQIKRRLDDGTWPVGHQLPSELTLAKDFGASYMTVRQAVRILVEQGRVLRVQGRGTFVSDVSVEEARPTIGLMLPNGWHSIDPFYYPPLVGGFVEEAERKGHAVHIFERQGTAADYVRIQDSQVKAVATVLVSEKDLEEVHELVDRGVSVVAVNYYGRRRVPSVSPDNFGGSWAATRHLISNGHRDIVYLMGPEDSFDAAERLAGVEQALKEATHSVRVHTLSGGFFEESGYDRGRRLVKEQRLPTAVMTASDVAAVGLMRALQEAGVSVPNEVSVVGFGDFRLAAYLTPSLTTVALPLAEVGRRAAEALLNRIRGVPQANMTVPCGLVLRESLGPPRSAMGGRTFRQAP